MDQPLGSEAGDEVHQEAGAVPVLRREVGIARPVPETAHQSGRHGRRARFQRPPTVHYRLVGSRHMNLRDNEYKESDSTLSRARLFTTLLYLFDLY